MPAADTEQKRTGLPLLPGLLWAGVGLAPVAALLALFAGDSFGLIRVAIVLAVIALALIGASMALRKDDSVRSQVEDMVFEELDIMRDDLREDITTAARATHKAVGERMVTLQESVDALRGQVDNLRSQVHRAPGQQPSMPQQQPAPHQQQPPPPSASPVGPSHGVVRHTETVKVTTRSTIVDNNDNAANRSGTVYGSRPPDPAPAQRRGSEYGAAAAAPAYPANGSGYHATGPEQSDSGSWTQQLLPGRLGGETLSDRHRLNARPPRGPGPNETPPA